MRIGSKLQTTRVIDGEVCHGLLSSSVLAVLVSLVTASAAGQDTVYLGLEQGGQRRVTGRIVDYTGTLLTLELPDGRSQSFPGEQVLRIETQYGPRHVEADAALARGDPQQALVSYNQAMEQETRTWVLRRIVVGRVWCYRGLDRPVQAGEQFLLLIRSDPATPYFDCIPLAWTSRSLQAAGVGQAAVGWLSRPEPAAVLLGASHLMGGPNEALAMARLRALISETDRRVAQLAVAQTWRAALMSVDDEQIGRWQTSVRSLPPDLAAGPYFVLGQALARREHWQEAALALLRVPILYPKRPLAARALLEAGRCLEKLGQRSEPLRLYHEILRDYPRDLFTAAEARSRIESMRKTP